MRTQFQIIYAYFVSNDFNKAIIVFLIIIIVLRSFPCCMGGTMALLHILRFWASSGLRSIFLNVELFTSICDVVQTLVNMRMVS